jgi:hypothetical protein
MLLSRNFIRSNSVLQANQKLAAVQSYLRCNRHSQAKATGYFATLLM